MTERTNQIAASAPAPPVVRQLAKLAGQPGEIDQLIAKALEALKDSIPYHVAAFLTLDGETLEVRTTRGEGALQDGPHPTVALERHPTLRRVLETARPALLDTDGDTAREDHPLNGIVELPHDHPCLMVPVVIGDDPLGVLVFTAAEPHVYRPEIVEIATVYGVLIGLGLEAVRKAEQLEKLRERLEEENRLLVEETSAHADACAALDKSQSRAMRRLVRMAKQVAITDAPVLITGETGTGKEVLARAIHGWSNRAGQPFIKINCAALPESLIESELFGHRRGAFSGAVRDRPGRFRLADGGTLFLDEIGDLPAATQVKLLRVLEEGAFEPVGSDETVNVDVRLLAATNVDLEAAIEDGAFREDLYYRLHVFPIHLPPLRERPEDLPILVEHILEEIRHRTGRGPWTIAAKSLDRMRRYAWPGNVRELVNTLERARVFSPPGGELTVDPEAPERGRKGQRPKAKDLPTLREHEREYIERVLEKTAGKIYGPDGAAAVLDLPPSTLQSRMKRLGVQRSA